jgi:hypothetical protein
MTPPWPTACSLPALAVEVGQYEEARVVLRKAVALAPPDDTLARNNLSELEKRARRRRSAKKERA